MRVANSLGSSYTELQYISAKLLYCFPTYLLHKTWPQCVLQCKQERSWKRPQDALTSQPKHLGTELCWKQRAKVGRKIEDQLFLQCKPGKEITGMRKVQPESTAPLLTFPTFALSFFSLSLPLAHSSHLVYQLHCSGSFYHQDFEFAFRLVVDLYRNWKTVWNPKNV